MKIIIFIILGIIILSYIAITESRKRSIAKLLNVNDLVVIYNINKDDLELGIVKEAYKNRIVTIKIGKKIKKVNYFYISKLDNYYVEAYGVTYEILKEDRERIVIKNIITKIESSVTLDMINSEFEFIPKINI